MDAIALAGYFNRFLLLDEEYGGSASDLEPVWRIARFSDPRSLFRNFYLSNEPKILIEGERGEPAKIRLRYKQRRMILSINDRKIVWYQKLVNIGSGQSSATCY